MSEEEIPAKGSADEHFQRAGETLATARVEKGMSLEQVSDRLKISLNYLRALEACHYDQLPGTAFARGYLRSYARLMELDENHILSLFGETVQADEQVARLLQEKPLDNQGPAGGKWLIVISAILLLGFVAGSVYWWRNGSVQDEMPKAPVAEFNTSEIGELDADPATPEGFEVIQPAPESEMEEEELRAPEAAQALTLPVEIIEPEQFTVVATDAAVIEEPAPAVEDVAVIEDRLLIQFSGDCWVEVKDAAGAILFSGIKTTRSELRLSGNAPLKIKFGNVGSVTGVSFNGEPVKVDFSGTGSKIGRLTLG